MRITRVDSFLMSYPMARPLRLPFWNGERTILKRDALYVRITTDSGLTGFAPGPAHERAQREIHEVIRPLLLGQDPRRFRELTPPADPETAKTYRAVEIALMDVVARDEGRPLSELIGGRVRERIKLYGSAGMYMAPEAYAEEAAAIQGLGFPAYKMRPALGPERDLETVERMRAATGPGFGLMIDAHSWWRMGDHSYSFETVADLARSLSAIRPVWLEEPLPPEDHTAYARLRGVIRGAGVNPAPLGKAGGLSGPPAPPIPIATGEHEPGLAGFHDLVAKGAADVLQMDVCCQGGFAIGRAVVEAAAAHRLRFAFHSWGTALEVLAAAHFGVCFPEDVVEWLEFPCYANAGRPGMYPFPLADEILAEGLEIHDGYLTVPRGPGLGIAVNESVAEKYPFLPGPWSFFHIASPPETIAVTGDHSVKWVGAPR